MPFRAQTWVVEREEDAAFTPPADSRSSGCRAANPLVPCWLNGELPALMTPQTPSPCLMATSGSRGCFPTMSSGARLFQGTGIFPIMHVTAIKQEIVDRYPWVPMMLCRAFEEAKQVAYRRMANVRVVPLPWFGAHGRTSAPCSVPIRGPTVSAMRTARHWRPSSATPTSKA